MRSIIYATTLAATAYAQSSFLPAPGTVVTCNTTTDNVLSPSFLTIAAATVNNACAALLPPCAYPNRLPPETVCIQSIDFPLPSAKSNTQSLVDIQNLLGAKVNGLGLKFTITPAANPIATAGVFWSKYDCYGYFAYLLGQYAPKGCRKSNGFGIGSLTVGDQDQASLSYSVFQVEFVPLGIAPVSSVVTVGGVPTTVVSVPAIPS